MAWDRALQVAGVAIIVISIVAVTGFTQAAKSPPDSGRSAGTNVAGVSQGNTVEIPLGAGDRGTLFAYFSPDSIEIAAGDTVTWVNRDAVSHTVTSVAFNSGQIWPQADSGMGSPTFSHTFGKKGVYSYFCQIHPYMSGTVYVDSQETQRQLASTTDASRGNIVVEMPQGSAYEYKFDQGFFIPANAFVPVGSRVTWVNNDYVAHTATGADGSFDTKIVEPRESKTLVVDQTGRIAYYCRIHPWMQASLTVLPDKDS